MKAMVLTAGEGTRMRPLTERTPKALLSVGGVPLLDYTLRWLARCGVTDVVLNLHHLGKQIRDFVGDGRGYGLAVHFSEEERLLGTAGAVQRLAPFFDTTFAVVYGDVLTNMALGAMLDYHRQMRAQATIAVYGVEDVTGKGVVEVDEAGWVRSFAEKPASVGEAQALVNGGIYLLEPPVLDYLEPGVSDFGHDVFPRWLKLGVPISAWRLRPQEYLLDIGTPEAYHRANEDAAAGRIHLREGASPPWE